ncbi:MAG: ABC transporter ATP-binding protein [Pseudomonadota bacterium]
MSTLLDVRGLSLSYRTRQQRLPVLHDVGFTLAAGETLGLVGESGSGKSQIALALMGLLPINAEVQGSLVFEGCELTTLKPAERRALRGARMGLIFQDPMTSLNPHLSIGLQLAEVLEQHQGASRAAALAESARMLDAVRIPEAARRLKQYPHELSGGQRQRVMIAMMLLARPAVLIADEPTTALDVTVQAEILKLLATLQREMGLALLMISHDLGVMADIADELLVLYAGRVMEQGAAKTLLAAPKHPYTQALLACRPRLDSPLYLAQGLRLPGIAGLPARVGERSKGCVFAPRCALASAQCSQEAPLLRAHAENHRLACHRA